MLPPLRRSLPFSTTFFHFTTPRPTQLPAPMETTDVKEEEETRKKERKIHVHYDHTDGRNHLRWTAREAHLFMHQRPWQSIVDFYSDLVRGCCSLSDLFQAPQEDQKQDAGDRLSDLTKIESEEEPPKNKKGRWARVTYKIELSYHGISFDGWQKQPGLKTVQGLVESSLGSFVDEEKAQKLKDRSLPVEACAQVAGRTDKGVSALRQVCSFYTWRNDIRTEDIKDAVNSVAPGKLSTKLVCKVPRAFHPNFSAKWRRYFYIFPIIDGEKPVSLTRWSTSFDIGPLDDGLKKESSDSDEDNRDSMKDTEADSSRKPQSFSISKVNRLVQQLEGKCLSYKMFARDTKASRSMGPATDCYMFHARAAEARLPCVEKADACGQRVMCIELVANRFLRKMVRVLVSTAIREAAAGANDEALVTLMDATCRRATAPPAPPYGLCLADVGYNDFIRETCLII